MEPQTGVDPLSLLEHKEFVRGVVRGLLADESAVDDVVQETYLRAIERPPRHSGVRAWLGRVGRNLALTALRAQHRRGHREHEAARPEGQPSASEAASRLERHRLVVEAVLALEEPFRSAILLRFYEDLPPREIARQLGVPIDTVNSRLRRGLERLRARFDARHGGDRAAWTLALLPLLGAREAAALSATTTATGGGTKVLTVEGLTMTTKAKLVGAAIVVCAIGTGTIAWQATTARDRPATPRTELPRAAVAEDEARPERGGAVAKGSRRSEVERPETLPDHGIGPPAQGSVTTGATVAPNPDAPKPYRIAEPCGEQDVGALRVIVTDAAGNPLPGTKILAGIIKGGQGSMIPEHEAGADGRLEIRSLEPGKWSVSGIALSHQRVAVVEIEAGRFTEVAVTLAGGATVEGTVRHLERGPLAEVQMSIEREENGFYDHFNATTDAQGRYRLEGIPPGNYPVSLMGKVIGYDERPRATLVVPGPGTVTQDIVLGRIALRGTVRDADTGAPITGVTVQFQGPWWGNVATDNDGVYAVADLAPAKYKVCLTRDGYGTQFGETGQVPPDSMRTADFTLRRAAVLVLEVLDSDGRPLPGSVDLGVAPVGGGSTGLGTSLDVDSSGVGRYPKIVPGSYDIDVGRRGYLRQKQRVEVKAGETRLTFRLERDGAAPQGRLALQGTVRDSATGRPIAGARVSFQEIGHCEALSDADGAYRLFEVPPGSRVIIVERDGYGIRFVRDVKIGAEAQTLDFNLDPAATLHLHVTDSAGRPVVGPVFLGMHGRDEKLTNVGTSVEADAEGHGVYKQILPGQYKLRVLKDNVGEANVEVEILPGENVVRVRLE